MRGRPWSKRGTLCASLEQTFPAWLLEAPLYLQSPDGERPPQALEKPLPTKKLKLQAQGSNSLDTFLAGRTRVRAQLSKGGALLGDGNGGGMEAPRGGGHPGEEEEE